MERVQLAIKQDRLAAKIPYANGLGPELAKTITGRKWHPEGKFWSYPLKYHNAKKLNEIAKEMGLELAMSEKVRAWGLAEKAKLKQDKLMQEAPHTQIFDLPNVRTRYPEMWAALESRPFQTKGVAFGLDKHTFLLGDDPGLGKTLQTIALMAEYDVTEPILIVANVSAKEISWPNEIRKWDPDATVTVFGPQIPASQRGAVIEKVFDEAAYCERNGVVNRQYVLMNPYWVQMKVELDEYGKFVRDNNGLKIVKANVPEIFAHEWGAIVADESHETLACSTGNAKKWSQQRVGMSALRLAKEGFKISISGTPTRGKPTNMFGQLEWLKPEEYTSFWKWAGEYFVVTQDGYGDSYQIGELLDPIRFYTDLNGVMIRRQKSEVANDLPPKQYGGFPHPNGDVVGIWLPMGSRQKKQYKDFVNTATITDENGNEMGAVGALAMYTRMKQLAGSCGSISQKMVKLPVLDHDGNAVRDPRGKPVYEMNEHGDYLMVPEQVFVPELPSNKYDWLKEWLMERDLLGKDAKGTSKVIIASQYRQIIDLFADELWIREKTKSYQITGATSAKSRVEQQDKFQNDPDSAKLFFLQSKAGGTSLTLDMADDVIILDEAWDPDIQNQVEDRAHRLSRKHNVTIWYPRSLETVEEYIGTTVQERNEVTHLVLNGKPLQKKLLKG